MLVNYVDFYLLNHLVNLIVNIPYVFVQAMDFDRIFGQHLSNVLTFDKSMNSMLQLKAMHISV